LLESICDSIDGAITFVTLFCGQSMIYALKNNKVIDVNTKDIEGYINTKFLEQSTEIIGETCLVALTAISYTLPRRADLVPFFESVLHVNID
jgi:hypothetical protein